MVLGGAVKALGAGLACPDWPLCHGAVVPNLADPLIAIEWVHRAVALATGLILLATLVLALLWFRADRVVVLLASMSLVALGAQITLGALTIVSRLDPVVVTSHLALATAVFASALVLAVLTVVRPPETSGAPAETPG